MFLSLRHVASVAVAITLLSACDKGADKAGAKNESAKSEDDKVKDEKPQKPTELKVEAKDIEAEFNGTYDMAVAAYSGVGFRVVFAKGCEAFACDKSGYLDFGAMKKMCPKGTLATVKVKDKEVVPEPGTYDAEFDVNGLEHASNNAIEGTTKKKLTLTAASKTEVTGTVDIVGKDGNQAKGRFKAKVCPHS